MTELHQENRQTHSWQPWWNFLRTALKFKTFFLSALSPPQRSDQHESPVALAAFSNSHPFRLTSISLHKALEHLTPSWHLLLQTWTNTGVLLHLVIYLQNPITDPYTEIEGTSYIRVDEYLISQWKICLCSRLTGWVLMPILTSGEENCKDLGNPQKVGSLCTIYSPTSWYKFLMSQEYCSTWMDLNGVTCTHTTDLNSDFFRFEGDENSK